MVFVWTRGRNLSSKWWQIHLCGFMGYMVISHHRISVKNWLTSLFILLFFILLFLLFWSSPSYIIDDCVMLKEKRNLETCKILFWRKGLFINDLSHTKGKTTKKANQASASPIFSKAYLLYEDKISDWLWCSFKVAIYHQPV